MPQGNVPLAKIAVSKGIKISSTLLKTIFWAAKLLIVAVAFWYIYQEVFLKENITDILSQYQVLLANSSKQWLLVVILLLMPVNWALETVKWKTMVAKLEYIGFGKAYEGVLSGVTVSFFTPNRMGEYVGRVFHLDKADKIKATLISILGSMSQLLATLLIGLLALIAYLFQQPEVNVYVIYGISSVIVLLMVVMLLLYINTFLLSVLLLRIRKLRRFVRYIRVFSLYSSQELLKILILSAARYAVFATQFVLLLMLLDVTINPLAAYQMIALIYLTMSVVPTIALSELGVRGSIAIYFLGQYAPNNHFGILTASFSLWVVNLVVPALVGAFFVLIARWRIRANKTI